MKGGEGSEGRQRRGEYDAAARAIAAAVMYVAAEEHANRDEEEQISRAGSGEGGYPHCYGCTFRAVSSVCQREEEKRGKGDKGADRMPRSTLMDFVWILKI